MAERTKTLGPLGDADLAVMALAGVPELVAGSASPTTGAAASYTMTHPNAKRALVTHMGAAAPAAGDIRFTTLTTATANSMPLYPQRYVVIEAVQGVAISFFNTSADTIKVYVLELP